MTTNTITQTLPVDMELRWFESQAEWNAASENGLIAITVEPRRAPPPPPGTDSPDASFGWVLVAILRDV
jgi:hypothetical protein